MIYDWDAKPSAIAPRTYFVWDDDGLGNSSGLTPPTPSTKIRGRVGLVIPGTMRTTTEV